MPMYNRFKLMALLLGITVLFCSVPIQGFGKYYSYEEDNRYWWYISEEPAFEIVIPALQVPGNIRYFTEQVLFGEESVEIHFKQNGPVFTMGYVKGKESDIPKVQKALLGRYEHLFSDIKTVESRKLQTNLLVPGSFIHQSAKTADGKSAMIRAIFFTKGDAIVYITYFCYQNDFVDFPREAWFKAVNTFKWR